MSITVIEKARNFAEQAHVNQRRKYTNEPYITHPANVVKIVMSVPYTDEMLCAAWLHDTVEDTPVTIKQIKELFGETVAGLVSDLTDVSKPSDGNRRERKKIDREHTAKASAQAKTIKLADLIDNSRNIIERDIDFAKVYLPEKAELLNVLKEGDNRLWTQANIILANGFVKLKKIRRD